MTCHAARRIGEFELRLRRERREACRALRTTDPSRERAGWFERRREIGFGTFGQKHMIMILAAIWFAFMVVLLIFFRPVRKMARAIRCPLLGTQVWVRGREALPEEHPIEVRACSAFTPPTAITCDRQCAELRGAPTKSTAGKAS